MKKQPTETKSKGLIINGVEHRKVPMCGTLKEGDMYNHGSWQETFEILGKTYLKIKAGEKSEEDGDLYVSDIDGPGDYYREVKTEAKPPPESFLKKIAMECGTVDGYAPSDLMHWIESVK